MMIFDKLCHSGFLPQYFNLSSARELSFAAGKHCCGGSSSFSQTGEPNMVSLPVCWTVNSWVWVKLIFNLNPTGDTDTKALVWALYVMGWQWQFSALVSSHQSPCHMLRPQKKKKNTISFWTDAHFLGSFLFLLQLATIRKLALWKKQMQPVITVFDRDALEARRGGKAAQWVCGWHVRLARVVS